MQNDGRADFDFLVGRWRVAHRRLRDRSGGGTAWDEFGGTCECRLILGGAGNVDEHRLELPGGAYRAASLRLFDPAARQWTIWWVDGRKLQLGAPVRGGFAGNCGQFVGEDVEAGRTVLVRYRWTKAAAGALAWEQAFSTDGGANWETNWIMRFTEDQ